MDQKTKHMSPKSNDLTPAPRANRPPPLLDGAGWLSQATFHWVQPMINQGKRHEIREENLHTLSEQDECLRLAHRIDGAWKQECTQHPKKPNFWRMLFQVFKKDTIVGGVLGAMESVVKISQAVFLGSLIKFFQDPEIPLST
ncbi:Multidrug resistance-associated protein 4, partial [Dispira parvispora]